MATQAALFLEFFRQQRALSPDAVEALTYLGFDKLSNEFDRFQQSRRGHQADPVPLMKWQYHVLERIKSKCGELD